MDYSIITEEDLKKRLNELPAPLAETIMSGLTLQNTKRITRSFNLDDDQQLILEQLITLTLMGFVSIDELAEEIEDNLDLRENLAQKLNEDIKLQILQPYVDDLKRIYSPIEESGAELWEKPAEETIPEVRLPKAEPTEFKPEIKTPPLGKTISLEKFSQPKTPEAQAIEKPFDIAQGKPLMIHEEKSPVEVLKPPDKPKSFNLPFNFFKSGLSKIINPPAKARVEAPEQIPLSALPDVNKKDEKKVVHYSELRTPLTPLHREEELINLETLEKVKKPSIDANIRMNTNNTGILNKKIEETPKPSIPTTMPIMPPMSSIPQPKILTEPPKISPKPMFVIDGNQNATEVFKNTAPLSAQKQPMPPTGLTGSISSLRASLPQAPPPKPPELPKNSSAPKSQPKIEGNIVDLR